MGPRRFAALVLVAALGTTAARAQVGPSDSLEAARKLYASAAYEDALGMLERVKTDDPPRGLGARRDLEATRALCLLALGREREARQAMEAVVFVDPQFEFDERDFAPRVRALLEETRAKRLPQIIRQRYGEAREAYDRGAYDEAAARFDSVLVLLDDPVLRQGDEYPAMQDMALLARDFHQLSTKAVASAAAAAASAAAGATPEPPAVQPADAVGTVGRPPAASPSKPPPAPGAAPVEAPGAAAPAAGTPAAAAGTPAATPAPEAAAPSGDAQPSGSQAPAQTEPAPPASGAVPAPSSMAIVAPVALEQPVPAWSEDLNLEPGRSYQATVEVVIDEAGRVTSARMIDAINPVYDSRLIEAVRRWRYRPGTRAGVPVRFTKLVTITVEAR